MRYIFVDLDHTLFHSSWRDHLSPTKGLDSTGTEEHDWDKYSEAGRDDPHVPEMVALLQWLYNSGYRMVVLTAINDKYRELVSQRLIRARVIHIFDAVLMRPVDDRSPSPILKPALAIAYLKVKERTGGLREHAAFVVEDRADVVEAFKALGVSCLQAHVVQR